MPCASALVTGATGFVGPYAVDELLRSSWQVWTLDRHEHPNSDARSIRADLNDAGQVRRALEATRPDVILHLAAQSSVPISFKEPIATLQNNLMGAANLLYAACDLDPMPQVLMVGSSEEYGRILPEQLPVDEGASLAPVSPYGVSKAAQSLLALSLWHSRGLPSVVLRPFNHTGPGQQPRFVVPAFAQQVARIEAGLDEPVLRVGNLESRRDFTDVRDIARAYALAARAADAGEVYNLGSGRSVPIRWVVDELLHRSHADIRVEPDPERLHPADTAEVRANPEKFRRATGWEPEIDLKQTIQDVLDYWRQRVAREQDRSIDRSNGE